MPCRILLTGLAEIQVLTPQAAKDATNEAELEVRLNREFENPVNNFLFEMSNPRFVLTDARRRQLTFYVTLLFNPD